MFNKIYQQTNVRPSANSDTFRVHGAPFSKRILRCHLRECRTFLSF